jgi:iron(III) transport system substrate-binding protein
MKQILPMRILAVTLCLLLMPSTGWANMEQFLGAPLDYVIKDPTLLSLTSLAMPEKTPHPHAAALFYDFLLSKDGQRELAKEKKLPLREDVELVSKGLPRRLKEGRARKKFVTHSPGTYDPVEEQKYDRLYLDALVKKK